MKVLKNIFQMKFSSKKMAGTKKLLAIVLLPVMLFYMTSFNFALVNFMNVQAQVDKEEVQEKTEESEEVSKDEEPEKSEELSEEENAESDLPENDVQKNTNEEEEEEIEESSKEDEVKPETSENNDSQKEDPEWKRDGEKWTIGPVEKDKTYEAPQNKEVTVTFTKLPENPGNLVIEEIILSDEQVKELGALSSKAYDITSSMENGTFEYDLTLPKPDNVPGNVDEVQVKYAEDKDELDEAKTVEKVSVKDDKIEAEDLDHFTIFILTSTDASYVGNWVHYPTQGYQDGGVDYPTTIPSGQTATWTFSSLSSTPDNYDVYISWSTHGNRTTSAPYTLNHDGGSNSFNINQEQLADQATTGGSGEWSGWYHVGNYSLDDSSNLVLESVDNSSGSDYVIADTVAIVDDNDPFEVWVDDDYSQYGTNDYHIWGYDAFDNIQEGITAASSGGKVNVASGIYEVTSSINVDKILTITTNDSAVVKSISMDTPVFNVTADDVVIEKLEITTDLAPFSQNGASTGNETTGALVLINADNVEIRENTIHSDERSLGAMSTWTARGITLQSGSATIEDNTVYGVRNGIIARYNTTAYINDNTIFSTKGGIMNYTNNQSDANNREMRDNSWGATASGWSDHNEWDLVWNSASYDPNYDDSVFQLSQDNNDAYVVDRRDTNADSMALGNRSHIFVNPSGETTAHEAKGNFNEPFANIGLAVDGIVGGGMIYVDDGTYTEPSQIVVDKDVNIEGESKAGVIVQPGFDTNTATYTDTSGWFFVKSGAEFSLQNATLDGSGKTVNAAIQSRGNVTIENCAIQSIYATQYIGFGIQLLSGTNNQITDCELENIERVGIHVRGNKEPTDPVATITDSSYVGRGVGDYLEYGIEFGGGGSGVVDNFTVSNNLGADSGWSSAGILVTDLYGTGTDATIENSIFEDNVIGLYAGYGSFDNSTIILEDNEFLGNTLDIKNQTLNDIDAKSTISWSVSDQNNIDQVESVIDHNCAASPYTHGTCNTGDHSSGGSVDYWELQAPTLIDPANNSFVQGASLTSSWSSVQGAAKYIYESYHDAGATNLRWHAEHTSTSKTATNVSDAVFWWRVKAVDSVGNEGPWSDLWKVTVDNTPPSAPTLISPTDGAFVSGNPTQTWSLVSDADHYFYQSYSDAAGNNPIYDTTVSGTSRTVGGMQTLTFYWRVKAVDAAGNESDWSSIWELNVDNTSPTATIDGVAPKSAYNDSTSISVHAIDDNYLQTDLYRVGESTPFKTYTGAWFGLWWLADDDYRMVVIDKAGNSTEYMFTVDTAEPTGTISYNPSSPTNGDVVATLSPSESVTVTNNSGNFTYTFTTNGTFTFEFEDAAGNMGTAVATVNNIDKTAPDITFDEPLADSVQNGLVHLKATCNEDCDYVNFWWREEGESFSSASKRYHYVHTNGTNFEWDLNTLNAEKADGTTYIMTDGTYYLYAAGKDLVGNWSRTLGEVKIVVDNTAPTVAITSPSAGYVSGVVDVRGTVVDENPHHYWLAIYRKSDNSQVYSTVVNHSSSFTDQSIYSWDTTGLVDGEYEIKFAARDIDQSTGNRSSDFVVDVTVDNTDPESTIDGGSSGEIIYSNSWYGSIAGTASDALCGVASVELSIQRASDLMYWNGTSWQSSETSVPAIGTTTWSYILDSLAEDVYTIQSHAIDNAGNRESTYTLIIVYDKTIPEVDLSVDPSSPDGDNDWYDSKPEVTLTASDNTELDRIEYQIDSKTGTWKTYSSSVKISDGKHVFYYRSLDKAGNYSDIGSKNIKVDTDNPDAVSDLEAEYREDTNSVKLTWDAEDDVEKVYIYRGKSSGFNLNTTSRLTKQDADDDDYTDDDVTRGETYYYKLRTYDEAGNKSDKVKVISVEIPQEGGAAIITDEGIVPVTEEDEGEGEIAGDQSEEGGEESQQEEGNGEQVLGEETINLENEEGMPWWLWVLAGILGIGIVYWYYTKKKKGTS